MRQELRTALMIGLFSAGAAFAGCASTAKNTKTTALTCPACKTVWVKTTDRYGADHVVQVQEEPQIVCEYCKKRQVTSIGIPLANRASSAAVA